MIWIRDWIAITIWIRVWIEIAIWIRVWIRNWPGGKNVYGNNNED